MEVKEEYIKKYWHEIVRDQITDELKEEGFQVFDNYSVVCFRMGLTSKEFENIDNNRIFGEYCFCILLLFLVVCNYLG